MYGMKTAAAALCLALVCVAHAADEQPSPPAHYDFAYAVNEPATGDQKDQRETRDGDRVNGYYRTLDSDGYVRTVNYKSDAVNGFTAEVIREPASGSPAKASPPAVVPAPYVASAAAPYVAPYVAPAAAPYVAPAPYFYAPGPSVAAAYPYYNYQPYPYAYSPYPYQPYNAQYPFVGQYPSPSEAAAVRQ